MGVQNNPLQTLCKLQHCKLTVNFKLKIENLMTVKQFQTKILKRFDKNARDLPRRNTTDPYKILVSELMLHQTQVSRVLGYYERFLHALPTLQDLASADKKTLFLLRQGLGYNNRVLRLQQCAVNIINDHSARVPSSFAELIKLPGIGTYTANALLAFAFNVEAPVMDTNIRRVLIHSFGLDPATKPQKLLDLASSLVPKGLSRRRNSALMDYGAIVLTSGATGIKSLTKQSRFEGSTRQVRSKILKLLLQEETITLNDLKQKFPRADLETIVKTLERDGIVERMEGKITLKKQLDLVIKKNIIKKQKLLWS